MFHDKKTIWYVAVILGVIFIALAIALSMTKKARAQTAQESVERTIGTLVVQNATCGQNLNTINAALGEARKELEEARKEIAALKNAPK